MFMLENAETKVERDWVHRGSEVVSTSWAT